LADLSNISEEQRLRLLVSSVTDYAIYLLDPSGVVSTWNAGARRFKGYEPGEIIGEHFSRFFPEEERSRGTPASILKIAAEEGRFEGEGWRVRKDGSRFLAHVVVDAIRNDEGELLGFAKITRDVTAQRERDKELYESEQRFRLLVQGVRDYAIYMLDTNGQVTNWNAGAEAIKGYSAEEIVGQHFSRFYTEQDRAGGEPQHALQTALKEGKYEREALRVRKDGTLFWAHVVIDPIFNTNGEHVGFAKITRDITERKQAQEELEEARAALVQSQKLQALGELTGGIAHDFNNLMTVIGGSADFLLRRPDLGEEKRQQYLQAIAETAERATTLTNHLLAFGRRQAIKPQVIDLNVRLDALSEMMTPTLGSKYKVTVDFEDAPARVEVDSAQLETAVLNAALNARDAMPDGGTITLSTRTAREGETDFVRLAITDTGGGMPPEVMERVFEPFFTTKEVGKGTGLGLSQIHGFAAQAGGRAEISSRPGEGTTVTLVLPATVKPLAESEQSAPPSSIPKGVRVLLVEDNAQVRAFAEGLLRDLGCEVITAEAAGPALELLETEPADLMLSDVVMPGMSGLQLARQVRKSRPSLPVLLATGYSDEIRNTGSEFAVIAKPFGIGDLSAAIAAALQERDTDAA
jgi:PAS domain S-box-containing protein